MLGTTAAANPANITAFASAAAQYGPFFFAILFVLFIPGVGYNWFMRMLRDTRIKSPEERASAIKACRLYWVSSIAMGLALVLFATMWWTFVQFAYVYPQSNSAFQARVDQAVADRVFRVQINNVTTEDVITAGADPSNSVYTAYADHKPFDPVQVVVVFNKTPPPGTPVRLFYMNDTANRLLGGSVLSDLTFTTSACHRLMLNKGVPARLDPSCA